MPAERRVDPSSLDDVAAQVTRSSHAALEASHELLAHYSDTGDPPTQRAVDNLIDHAADALRALTDSLADSTRALQVAALEGATPRRGGADGSSAGSGRGRDRWA